MLRLPPFRYAAPATARDAARLLADFGPDAMPVAGGTDLYPNMKRRQFTPRVLVGLRGLEEAYGGLSAAEPWSAVAGKAFRLRYGSTGSSSTCIVTS